MCQELEEELEKGKNAAILLAEHCENMGSGKIKLPVITENGCYQVTVVKTL